MADGNARISLVLADTQPVFLAGLKHLFSAEPDFSVADVCSSGDEVLESVRRLRPNVLVADLRLNGTDMLSLIKQIRSENLPTRIVLLTSALHEDETLEALRLGVQGVVLKEMPPELLNRAVRKVHSGGKWMETQSFSRALDKMLQRESSSFELSRTVSPRELAVIRSVTLGKRNKEIARDLSITEGTVKAHLHSIYEKLKVHGRAALTAYAQRKGLC